MGRVADYRELLKQILSRHAELINQASDEAVKTFTLFDETHDQYMLFRSGWRDKKRISRAIIYARLQDGKIWVEEDWTENGIATELLDKGVSNKDIVLGFRHPDIRPLTQFSVV